MAEKAPAPRETDEALIAAFQGGRSSAFEEIVGRYKDALVNFAYRYVGDLDDADDVAQETFIRVYRNRDSYKPVARFSTWLYTIAVNVAKSHLRRRKRLAFFSSLSPGGRGEERAFDPPDAGPGPDAAAEKSERRRMIQDALDRIPASYREVVILCDIQDLTYEEICGITGLAIGTVKSRLNRGRARLKRLLSGLLENE